jgi:hypothetical protein
LDLGLSSNMKGADGKFHFLLNCMYESHTLLLVHMTAHRVKKPHFDILIANIVNHARGFATLKTFWVSSWPGRMYDSRFT